MAGHPVQIIGRNGNLKKSAIDNFTRTTLAHCGQSYVTTAIIGSQSSGKSTLLNRLFNTQFKELDTSRGRKRTTEGVWISSVDAANPAIIVLDIEGSDSREKGDETLFERQSALFAFATADVILINIGNMDVGRWNASGMILFRIILKEMVRLFSPRKRTIVFVIRDLDPQGNNESVAHDLWVDIKKIWKAEAERGAFSEKGIYFKDFLNIEITGLPTPRYEVHKFEEEIRNLRRSLWNLISASIDKDRIPVSGISCMMEKIWQQIKENRDLNLPTHQIIIAKSRCEQIVNDLLQQFINDEDWRQLKECAESSQVTGFCDSLRILLDRIIDHYDKEVSHYDHQVKADERNRMISELLTISHPAYRVMLNQHWESSRANFRASMDRLQSLENFGKKAQNLKSKWLAKYDKECEGPIITESNSYCYWETTHWRIDLVKDIDEYMLKTRDFWISYFMDTYYEEIILTELREPDGIRSILHHGSFGKSWTQIRRKLEALYFRIETDVSRASLPSAGLNIDKEKEKKMIVRELQSNARSVVCDMAREEAQPDRIIQNMITRFLEAFSSEKDPSFKKWQNIDNEECVTAFAQASQKFHGVLCAMVAMRLDEDDDDETANDQAISKALKFLIQAPNTPTDWPELPSTCTFLISPEGCKDIWEKATDWINKTYINPMKKMREMSLELKISEKTSEIKKGKAMKRKRRIQDVLFSTLEFASGFMLIGLGNPAGIYFVTSGLRHLALLNQGSNSPSSSTALQKSELAKLQRRRNQNEVLLLTVPRTEPTTSVVIEEAENEEVDYEEYVYRVIREKSSRNVL